MNTQSTIIWGIIIIAAVVLVLGVLIINSNKDIGTLNSEGKAELTFVPDNAKVFVGVAITKPTAKEAQDSENQAIAAIVKELKAIGISEADIETESLSLYEDKVWTSTEMKSNGWRASQILKVKTSDFSKIGRIVDVSVNNGANEINNIQFYLSQSKENEYKKQVIAEASKSAMEKAKVMAESLGKKLGNVKSVTESSYNYMPYMYNMKNTAGVAASQESATILPSDVTVSANIIITYEII